MGGFGIDWYIILTNKTVTELVRWLGDDCVFFLYWDFVLTCLWHVYEALCATRHKEDRWSWMFMTFILQQQDHYKVLGLEKLRHKATLGDIKKACKFVILGCNSFNQIFFHVFMQGSFPRSLVWLHKCMNWWILTVRLYSGCGGVRKKFFSWIDHWIFFCHVPEVHISFFLCTLIPFSS